MRDERRKRIELNLDGQARIFEAKMRQRIRRCKFGGRDAAQAGRIAEPRPSCPSYGGSMRASSTRATGLESPALIQIAGKAYCGEKPLFGRLKISQSRS